MWEPQSNLEEKVNPSNLKDYFSSRTEPSIFTSIEPVLLDQSNKNSWVFPALKSVRHFLPQSTVSHRSDSSSEVMSDEVKNGKVGCKFIRQCNPWSNFCDPCWELICCDKWYLRTSGISTPLEKAERCTSMCEYGTKTTLAFLPGCYFKVQSPYYLAAQCN